MPNGLCFIKDNDSAETKDVSINNKFNFNSCYTKYNNLKYLLFSLYRSIIENVWTFPVLGAFGLCDKILNFKGGKFTAIPLQKLLCGVTLWWNNKCTISGGMAAREQRQETERDWESNVPFKVATQAHFIYQTPSFKGPTPLKSSTDLTNGSLGDTEIQLQQSVSAEKELLTRGSKRSLCNK